MAKKSASVSKARGATTTSRTPRIAAIATIVVLVVVVFGGIFLFQGDDSADTTGTAIPPVRVAASYTTSVQDGVVVAGPARAAHTLDVYEDALCPACQQFESRAGTPITTALDAGALQVRYHMVNLLEERSQPAGYSSLAGNAILCAAGNGAFPSVHASLYAAQPPENGRGYDAEQLVGLGEAVGAGPGYASCVRSGTHTAAVAENLQQASTNPALQQRSGGSASFGTPTLVLDGKLQTSEDNQLDAVLGS